MVELRFKYRIYYLPITQSHQRRSCCSGAARPFRRLRLRHGGPWNTAASSEEVWTRRCVYDWFHPVLPQWSIPVCSLWKNIIDLDQAACLRFHRERFLGWFCFFLTPQICFELVHAHGLDPNSSPMTLKIYGLCQSGDCSQLQSRVSECISDVGRWMRSNRLQLNADKTDADARF